MKPLTPGAALRQSFDVTTDDTAAAIGNTGVEVISTMAMVRLVETACYGVISSHYEDGDATVGTRVALDHEAPAYPGRPVDILATLTGVRGRKLTFSVEVEQDGRRIMTGEHVRATVRLDTFLGGKGDAATPGASGPQVEFWYDFHSPWCYFASFRVGNILRAHGGTVRWRPVHLPKLMERIDGRRPLEGIQAFVKWYRQDALDHAALYGLPYDPHKDYPLRPSRALRAALYADEQSAAEPFIKAVMQAYWAGQRDISDLGVLQELGESIGLAREGVVEAAGNEIYKAQIEANIEEAAERGVFGLPAMFFDGKLFWGNDRLELLDHWLGQWRAG